MRAMYLNTKRRYQHEVIFMKKKKDILDEIENDLNREVYEELKILKEKRSQEEMFAY
jgi:hypothetical protein